MAKTDEELNQIALDLATGKIFCDRHLHSEPELLVSVFLVFSLMTEQQHEEIQKEDPGLIYEYMDRAGPILTNGLPTFTTMQRLSQEETTRMFEEYGKILGTMGTPITRK